MNFFIRKNSTYPKLEYTLTQKIREKYNITDEMLENVAITFSMIDSDSGLYYIANVPANIEYKKIRPQYPNEITYILNYKFKLSDTHKTGRYSGEFVIDFINTQITNCLKLKLPVDEEINIIISDSITKTTVI